MKLSLYGQGPQTKGPTKMTVIKAKAKKLTVFSGEAITIRTRSKNIRAYKDEVQKKKKKKKADGSTKHDRAGMESTDLHQARKMAKKF